VQVTDDPRVGTELAGYRLESLPGIGGMSVVYLAEDLRLKRKVALKLLASRVAEDESFRDRFLRESGLAASIDQPQLDETGGPGDPSGWVARCRPQALSIALDPRVDARVLEAFVEVVRGCCAFLTIERHDAIDEIRVVLATDDREREPALAMIACMLTSTSARG
jgi:serine/threonine protein kinase